MVRVKELKDDGSESALESDNEISMDEMQDTSSEESILGDSDEYESGLESDDIGEEEGGSDAGESDEEMEEEQNGENEESVDEDSEEQNGEDDESANEDSEEQNGEDSSMDEEQDDEEMSNDEDSGEDEEDEEECPTLESSKPTSHIDNSIHLNQEDLNVLEDDEEIQAYLSAGKIKPGVTYEEDQNLEKEYPNCVPELKQKLKELKYRGPWAERLDVTCDEAPMAPEMQVEVREERKMKSANKEVDLQNPFKDMSVLKDDFEREVMFQRHAQAAVLLALPKLAAVGLSTKRPEDFFGQMVKSDDHMQKIRKKLQEKLLGQQASEHAKKIRKLRQFGKKVQTEVLLSKAEKKREMMKKLKAYRAGQISHLDFLEDDDKGNTGDENGGVFSSSRKKAPTSKNRQKSKEALNEMLSTDGPGGSDGFRGRGGRGGPRGGRGGPRGGRGGPRGGRGGPRGGRGGPRGGRGGSRGGRGGSRGGRGGSGGERGGPPGGRGGGGKFRGSSRGAAKRPGKGRRKSNN